MMFDFKIEKGQQYQAQCDIICQFYEDEVGVIAKDQIVTVVGICRNKKRNINLVKFEEIEIEGEFYLCEDQFKACFMKYISPEQIKKEIEESFNNLTKFTSIKEDFPFPINNSGSWIPLSDSQVYDTATKNIIDFIKSDEEGKEFRYIVPNDRYIYCYIEKMNNEDYQSIKEIFNNIMKSYNRGEIA